MNRFDTLYEYQRNTRRSLVSSRLCRSKGLTIQ